MIKSIIEKWFLCFRKIKYYFFSNNKHVNGVYTSHQPVITRGNGTIHFNENVNFGVINSPMFYNGYAYIEARSRESEIFFGNNVHINNAFSMISEVKITIKDNVLIGYNCHISDSNFHDLSSNNRNITDFNPKEVIINNNVFIGNNVTILKGVVIGENSIVGAGSVVTKSFPENVTIGGCPAKIISKINNSVV